jgi:class 3 adenylate cyclase
VDERLAQAVADLGTDRWAALAVDADARIQWVSDELRGFLRDPDDTELGIGASVTAAFLDPTWTDVLTPESGLALYTDMAVFLSDAGLLRGDDLAELPEPIASAVAAPRPGPPREILTGAFEYLPANQPSYVVQYLATLLRDSTGKAFGCIVLTNVDQRPTLLSWLGRGDTAMYERMAKLVTPGRHSAAIIFADLEASGGLSRHLPTAAYFTLIRDLTSAFDAAVSEELGIVGKHAGDGWTAFVLTDDVGGPSAAARAALTVVRRLIAEAGKIAAALSETLPSEVTLRVNAGLHWGGGVYLGQLVPAGRLEVTALGDEVNECARIEQTARNGTLLASKQLIELLSPADAASLGLDPSRIGYESLGSLDTASDKARRDAGGLAVAVIPPE